MRLNQMLLLLAVPCILLFSCKKEESLETGNGNASPAQLQGTWDFVAMHAYTYSTGTSRTGNNTEKTVLITDYETIDNGGYIAISGNKLAATDLTYTADTEIKAAYYLNGVQEDAFALPFLFTAPEVSSLTTFQLIGADSIHFEKSFITAPDGTTTGTGSDVTGSRYSFSGDTLVLATSRYVSYATNEAGTVVNYADFARVVTKYKKRS